jgi:hypothetical protein
MERRTEERDDTILTMICAAVMAGAYRSLAAELPEARIGLLKMAAKHSARAATLAGQISADVRRNAEASATTPTRQAR